MKFDPRHFCMFQDPPCPRTECRVATHIIAGLFPLNFCKFLIKAYQPLNEEERKEVINIKNLYFTYLMQKFHDDKMKTFDPMSHMDLLSNLDDTDYSVFCGVGSAFAECYLIDAPIPVQEVLYACFIIENNDIALNMYWLECIYEFRANENSPLKKIENDPKVMELQLRMQMDQIGLNGPKLQAELTNREKKLLSVLKWTPDTEDMSDGIAEALGLGDCSKRRTETPTKTPSMAKATKNVDASTVSSVASSAASSPKPSVSSSGKTTSDVCCKNSTTEKAETMTKKSEHCDVVLPSIVKLKATTTAASGAVSAAAIDDEPLTDAVKIAVKQKLNQ